MKIDNVICKCGNEEFHVNKKGTKAGAYCNNCGKWIKWLNKNEDRLAQYKSLDAPNDYIVEE